MASSRGSANRKTSLRITAGILSGWLLLMGASPAMAARDKVIEVSSEARTAALDLLTQAAAAEAAGRKSEALRLALESARLAPSPAAHYQAGTLLAALGRRPEAIAEFDKALLLSPRYESARLARERLQKKHGIGNIDLVALEREAETAASLTEASLASEELAPTTSPRTLAQANTTKRKTTTGLNIPEPPKAEAQSAQPALPTPPKRVETDKAPARISDEEARPGIWTPLSKSVIQIQKGASKILSPGSQPAPSSAQPARGQTPPEPVKRTAPDANKAPAVSGPTDQGGSAKDQPVAGGRRSQSLTGWLPNLIPGTTKKPAPAPLPGSATFEGHDSAAINAAAFGPDAAKRPASVGYGQPGGTAALGTFAFHRDRGDGYRTLERWSEARQEYEFALRQAPGDAETRALLGEMQARIGDDRRALRNLDRAAKDAPTLSAVPYRRGNALRALDKKSLAIGAYLDAVRLDPANKDALNNLGVTYMETGAYDRSAQTFEKLLALDPNNPNAILNLGILNEEHLDDPKQAAQYYNRYLALEEVPRKQEVRRWLSLLQRAQNQ